VHCDRFVTQRIWPVGIGEHMYSICVGSVAARPPPTKAGASPPATAHTDTTSTVAPRLPEENFTESGTESEWHGES